MSDKATDEKVKEAVRQAYGRAARRFVEEPAQAGCCGAEASSSDSPEQSATCCGAAEAAGVEASSALRLYSAEELAALPDSVTDAVMGCGNPTAIAELQPGEVVLDLGSGGGIDCFLAAKQVGPEGRVIGLDMTPDMIRLARRNAKKAGATNVDFRFGEMEDMPLLDASVDVIISNCVINLSPDKDAVFAEAYRVLRPGGRMSISDIVVDGDLPELVRRSLDAWAGCVAGALTEADYLSKIRAAGFEGVEVESRSFASGLLASDDGELQIQPVTAEGHAIEGEEAKALLAEAGLSPHDLAGKVASIRVKGRKPA